MVENPTGDKEFLETHGLEAYRLPTIVCPNCGHQIVISFDTEKSLFNVKVEITHERK